MIGWLEIKFPDGRVDRVPVDRAPFHIGRYHSNHLVISEPYVSRFHCSIVREDDCLLLRDLESKSGTWVNGKRVETHRLKDGDLIQLHPATRLLIIFRRSTISSHREATGIDRAEAQFQAINWLVKNIRSLQSQTVLRDISRTLIKAAMELVDADYGMMMVKENDAWRITAIRGPHGFLDDTSNFQYSRSVIREVQETAQPVMTTWESGAEGASPAASMVALNIHNIICIPLVEQPTVSDRAHTRVFHRPQMTGLLYLDRRRPGMAFQASDLKVLMTLTDEAVRSLTFARLYQQVSQQERLEQELEWARRVQHRFLPNTPIAFGFATVDGFMLPTYEVGGDYFTILSREVNEVLVGVGDISGKGLDAALLMSLCQGALYALSMVHLKPNEYSERSRYTTLFLGSLQRDGTFSYVNAGHPPALWVRPDGSLQMLEATTPILGILDVEPRSQTIQLHPGDLVLLFSDGIFERISEGEVWNLDRWMEWVKDHLAGRAETVCERVRRAVEIWGGETYLPDDLTFIALSYEGEPSV